VKLLITISKVIAAIGTISAVVLGGFKIYTAIIDTKELVEYVNVEQTIMSEDIGKINDSLDMIKSHQVKQDVHMTNMEVAAKFYLQNQKAMTEEAMTDALEIMLKKNKDWNFINGTPDTLSFWRTYTKLLNMTYNSFY